MRQQRFLPLLVCLFILAGCYRQADDSFEPLGNQSTVAPPTAISNPTTVPAVSTEIETETEQPVLKPPTATDDGSMSDTDGQATSTDAPLLLQPTTNTPINLSVATATNIPGVIPTATQPTFITPEAPPGAVDLPTITPTATPEIIETPTAIPEEVSSECSYIVQAGDNLFRIALNNDTTVESLMSANALVSDAIQPGNVLQIPDCVPGAETTDEAPIAVETPIVVPEGGIIHQVSSGETLYSIAIRYGITINDIIAVNDLSNPDALDIGQEIIIPDTDDGG